MKRTLLIAVLVLLLVGCGRPAATATLAVPTPTRLRPTPTLRPTNTPFPTPTPGPEDGVARTGFGPPAIQYMLEGKDVGGHFNVKEEESDARGKAEGGGFPSDGLQEVSWRTIECGYLGTTIIQFLAIYETTENASAAWDSLSETAIPSDATATKELDSDLGDDSVAILVTRGEDRFGVSVLRVDNIVTLLQVSTRTKLTRSILLHLEQAATKIESFGG